MKRLLFAIIILLTVSSVAWAGENISVITVFTSKAIIASGSATSIKIPLDPHYPTGFFAIQSTVAGSGTCKLTYTLSSDDVTYSSPTDAAGTAVTDIVTGQTAGTEYHSFTPAVAKFIKIVATETGGADPITVTAKLVLQ